MAISTDNPPDPEDGRSPEDENPHDDRPEEEIALGNGALDLEAELEKVRAEATSLKDQLLRALAEGENTRRRAQRDREEFARYAAAPLAREILPVADNLARALAAVPQAALAEDEALRNL